MSQLSPTQALRVLRCTPYLSVSTPNGLFLGARPTSSRSFFAIGLSLACRCRLLCPAAQLSPTSTPSLPSIEFA
jgi:hypothetical protein